MDIIMLVLGMASIGFGLAAFVISLIENEKSAAYRFLIVFLSIGSLFLFLSFSDTDVLMIVKLAIIMMTCVLLLLFLLPVGQKRAWKQQMPSLRIDERHTMFSRNELIPGTEAFESYYSEHPEKKALDDLFRSKAGLLKAESSLYHPLQFAAADASFETIATMKSQVNGAVAEKQVDCNPQEITTFLKGWIKKLGAISCGVTELKPYHLYEVGGRADRRNVTISNDHKYALAFTVEMSKEMVDAAPSGSIVMESAQQYLDSGIIAIQVAAFIRSLGYEARAHIDGNYEVVCPLVAKDAGLGEIGRMGLLMTPSLGPRVRIAVVTTSLPILKDESYHDYSMIDFCEGCKKCADACPSQAISFEPRENIDGVSRWQINQEACFTFWCTVGTDCGRCMSVCPYSHPDNWLHGLVRFGIRNSSAFRPMALKLDDIFYGRKPKPREAPQWTQPKNLQ